MIWYKKSLIILMLFTVILTSVFIMPQKKAQAFAFLPQLGVGAYATAVLVGAGVLSLVGAGDNAEKLVNHAGAVWDGMTSASKKAWNGFTKVAKLGLNGAEVDAIEFDFSNLTLDHVENVNSAAHRVSYTAGKTYTQVPTTAYPEATFNTWGTERDSVYFPSSSPNGFAVYYSNGVIWTKGFEMRGSLYTYPSYGYGAGYYQSSKFWEYNNEPWANLGYKGIFSAYGIKTVEDFLIHGSEGIKSKIVVMTESEFLANRKAYNDAVLRGKAGIIGTVPKVSIPIPAISALNPDLTWDGANYRNPAGETVPWDDLVMPMPQVDKNTGKVGVAVPGVGSVPGTDAIVDTVTGEVIENDVPSSNPPSSDGGVSDGTFTSFWNWLKGILQSIKDSLLSLATMVGIVSVVESISSGMDTLTDWTGAFWASMSTTLTDSLANLDTFAEEFWGSLTDTLTLGLSNIDDFVTNYWDSYSDSFAKGLDGIGLGGIETGINTVVDWTTGFWDSYTDSFSKGLEGIDTFASEFWGSFAGSMSDAMSKVNTFVRDFPSILTGLFVPTLSIADWWAAISAAFANRIRLPDKAILLGFTDLGCVGVQDMYADIMGKRVKVFDGSYLMKYSYWWKNIASGLMWFLAVWWVWRKIISLFNRTGGSTP